MTKKNLPRRNGLSSAVSGSCVHGEAAHTGAAAGNCTDRKNPKGKGAGNQSRATASELAARLPGARQNANGWVACCPAHDDHRPSLSIATGKDGRVLLRCHAGCSFREILTALGIKKQDLSPPSFVTQKRISSSLDEIDPKEADQRYARLRQKKRRVRRKIVRKYDYRNADGKLLYQVIRYEPKDFAQRRPDPANPGKWIWNMKGQEHALYRLPEVHQAKAKGHTIFLAEGERDVDALSLLGLCATCNPGGAGKWADSYTRTLAAADVVILPDRDEPGRRHAALVREALSGSARSICVVELPDRGNCPVKDPADWIDAGGTVPELQAIVRAAPEWEPPSPGEPERQVAGKGNKLVIDPRDYFATGRLFLNARFRDGEFVRLLHHDGEFRRYVGTHWSVYDSATFRAALWQWLSGVFVKSDERKKPEKYRSNSSAINNITDAVKAHTNVSAECRPPCWLPGFEGPEPSELVPFQNILLHLRTGKTHPHIPGLFSTYSLPFDYEPKARAPAWMEFLQSVWPDDPAAIKTLQHIFGYIIAGETHLQKIFLLVGPKRGGKGTIAGVLMGLMGKDACCGPTLAGLATTFGLQTLIGRRLAVVSDARLSSRADQAAITERLLTISGEDIITVPRKYQKDWTGQIPARFMLLTNELPRLADSSGALASRFVVLNMRRSFYGQEDYGLKERLLAELPGVANWAIEGWHQLQRDGLIESPESARESIEELNDLGSPIGAFIRDCCRVEPGCEIDRQDLYRAWCDWCEEEGRAYPGTAESFGRDLRAALPELHSRQCRKHGKRRRVYHGIALLGVTGCHM